MWIWINRNLQSSLRPQEKHLIQSEKCVYSCDWLDFLVMVVRSEQDVSGLELISQFSGFLGTNQRPVTVSNMTLMKVYSVNWEHKPDPVPINMYWGAWDLSAHTVSLVTYPVKISTTRKYSLLCVCVCLCLSLTANIFVLLLALFLHGFVCFLSELQVIKLAY